MPEPETYAGDLWGRPRLTGNWGGARDDLAKRGVWLDVDLLQVLQGVGAGGRDTGVAYGGHADYRLQVDTGKLGLWPGGFLTLFAESSYGNNVNQKAGATEAVDTAATYPQPGQNNTTLSSVVFTQFLTEWFGVFAGKLDTGQGDVNEFANNYRTQFLYSGLQYNLVTDLNVPYTPLGAGIVVTPFEGADFSLAVMDPNGTVTRTGFDNFFTSGVTLNGEGRVTIKPFGLTGHQSLGFTWSNKHYVSLDQDPSNIARLFLFDRFPRLQDPGPILERALERFLPQLLVPVQPLHQTTSTWNVYYNFDQYLWQPQGDPTRGVGVFFRFGVSDGIANPVKYHYNVGIGGKGVLPGRRQDTFGVGWSHMEYTNNLVPLLRQRLGLGLEHEDAVELFYNFAITGWLNATADLQIVKPGLTKFLNSASQLQDLNTAVVGGLRVYTRF